MTRSRWAPALRRLLALPTGPRSRWVIVGVWIALAIGFGLFAGRLHHATTNKTLAFLPRDAESTKVAEILDRDFPSAPSTPAVIVYQKATRLTLADGLAIARDLTRIAVRLEGVAGVDLRTAVAQLGAVVRGRLGSGRARPGGPSLGSALVSPDGTTALLEIPIDSNEIGVVEPVVERIRSVVASGLPPGLTAYVTGPAGFMVDGFSILGSLETTLLVATVALILVLLSVIYRSVLVPILPLATVGVAYAVAAGLAYLVIRAFDLTVTSQATSLLVILMFGVGTDYCVYLVARYREELDAIEDEREAMVAALRRAVPAILSCGVTVIAAMLVLLVADLESTRTQGPVLALGVGVTMLAGLTLLPALLTIAGRRAFWPRSAHVGARRERTSLYGRIGSAVVARPVLLLVVCVGGLAVMAVGTTANLGSLSLNDGFRKQTGSLLGFEAIERAFPPGEVAPAHVVVEASGGRLAAATGRVTAAVGRDPAVASVRPDRASRRLGAAELSVSLRLDPFSDAALRAVPRLRQAASRALAGTGATALVGGATASEYDMAEAARSDAKLILPLTLALVFLVLAVLLRALVAPLYLIATVVLSYAATLGLSAVCFKWLFGAPGLMIGFSTILFIFLVALGVDYNVFLMTRIREEFARSDPRSAVLRGLETTGGVITTAGVILGGTFALAMLLPLWQLFQLGFAVAVGVLIDTVLVRTLVVPAITGLLGDLAWWPSRIRRPASGGEGSAILDAASGERPAHIERG